MSLFAVLSLTGCVASSSSLNENPKVLPIESVSDVSRLESDVKMLSKELQALLDTAQKTTDE
ncbi:hypothetical protein [uncultured Turicimonas sp.]|uniref:hypothetical protein n=1 Tax=uncultured Turicimonas sp. TaxID=1918607 RepID=UPI002803BFFD|nr:hypothetical protein [uncultured Turicimonas sp.]